METLAVLRDMYLIVPVLALCLCLVLVWFLYRLLERERAQRASSVQSDLTNMMILFQTMRDMLRQQKDLARQLNESLDKRVAVIKHSVESALRDLDALRENARRIALELEKTSAELATVQKQTAYLREDSGGARLTPTPEPARPLASPTPPVERPPLHVLARPTEIMESGDALDHWAGFDFGGGYRDDVLSEAPEQAPEEPGDAEAARQAFRALLNMTEEDASDGEPAGMPTVPVVPPQTKTSREAVAGQSGNGKGKANLTPLQARVYEYSDAGMTTPQISRELGIGKGEIRLILSLRSDKER